MPDPTDPLETAEPEDVQSWIKIIFESAQAKKGGVVRRDKAVFLKHCNLEALKNAVYDECFHLIETDTQYIIVCNNEPLIVHS